MNRVAAFSLTAALGAAGFTGYNYVDADRGGNVLAYVRHYDNLQELGVKVVIRGACSSSCTMALGYPNACVMPDAILGFHPAYTPILFGVFGYVLNQPANQLMLEHYPPDARAVLDAHGDLTRDPGGWQYPRLFYLRGRDFPQHYQCTDNHEEKQ